MRSLTPKQKRNPFIQLDRAGTKPTLNHFNICDDGWWQEQEEQIVQIAPMKATVQLFLIRTAFPMRFISPGSAVKWFLDEISPIEVISSSTISPAVIGIVPSWHNRYSHPAFLVMSGLLGRFG